MFLIVLSATSGGISIAPFATVIGAPSASFSFPITTGIVKKIAKNYTKENEKA